jgi:predicted deacylase
MYNLLDDVSVRSVRDLDFNDVGPGTIAQFRLHMVTDGIGQSVQVPVLVARGMEAGEVLGCTAVVHGDELNGIPVIQQLFRQIDIAKLRGTIVGIPIVNVPSVLRKQRRFIDGTDLNHIMPGRPDGNVSEVYAWRIMDKIVKHLDYLVDFHTASFGRINSYYIRADMDDPQTAQMAMLQNPQIIVHNPPHDGTLRGAAAELKIKAITLEVGDPNMFQKGVIRSSLTGMHNVLNHLGFTEGAIEESATQPVLCKHSYWLYADTGGILRVYPDIVDQVRKGDVIAAIFNIFGERIKEYHAPENGIIIGKSVSPICPTGGRLLHLGIVNEQ